jgi:hypothetical protein
MFRTISTLATSVVVSLVTLAGAGAAFARPVGMPPQTTVHPPAVHAATQHAAGYSPGAGWLAVAVVLVAVAAVVVALAARGTARPAHA